MATKPLVLKRKPPTRIVRKPSRGQMPLELKPRVRLATRRRRARILGVSLALLFSTAMTLGVSALSYHERFAINDIAVVGTHALSPAEVEATFGEQVNDGIRHFFSRANIFVFPQTELREALLRELPLLKAVSFNRTSLLSQAVTITVVEREPAYLWCNDQCYFMDSRGFVFSKATNPRGFFEFRGGLIPHQDPIGQLFMRGRLEHTTALVQGLNDEGYTVTSASIENERDVTLRLENGLTAKITNDANATDIAKNLRLIFASDAFVDHEREIEYVDLRFGNRVYYKMK